jgi:hypothetical protein
MRQSAVTSPPSASTRHRKSTVKAQPGRPGGDPARPPTGPDGPHERLRFLGHEARRHHSSAARGCPRRPQQRRCRILGVGSGETPLTGEHCSQRRARGWPRRLRQARHALAAASSSAASVRSLPRRPSSWSCPPRVRDRGLYGSRSGSCRGVRHPCQTAGSARRRRVLAVGRVSTQDSPPLGPGVRRAVPRAPAEGSPGGPPSYRWRGSRPRPVTSRPCAPHLPGWVRPSGS